MRLPRRVARPSPCFHPKTSVRNLASTCCHRLGHRGFVWIASASRQQQPQYRHFPARHESIMKKSLTGSSDASHTHTHLKLGSAKQATVQCSCVSQSVVIDTTCQDASNDRARSGAHMHHSYTSSNADVEVISKAACALLPMLSAHFIVEYTKHA